MIEYPKINTIFKRDEKTHKIIDGAYSLPEFEYLKDNNWIFTEKIDGTNIRIQYSTHLPDHTKGELTIGGRTETSQLSTKLYQALLNIFVPLLESRRLHDVFPDGGCIYGEGYGAGTQKGGGNYRQDTGFIVFDVRVGEWWLKEEDIDDVVEKLNLTRVPVVGIGTLEDAVIYTRAGFYSNVGIEKEHLAEGLVLRPTVQLLNRKGERILSKIKHKDFALTF